MAQHGVFHLGDVGCVIELQAQSPLGTNVDISAASGLTIYLRTPAGDVLTKTASLSSGGTDGKMRYTTVASDFPLARKELVGLWEAQGQYTVGGATLHTSIIQFSVQDSLG